MALTYEVKLPLIIRQSLGEIPDLDVAWSELMTWMACHMSTIFWENLCAKKKTGGKQKKDQILKKLGEWPNLVEISVLGLEALICLCVFRGILLEQDGVYKRNKVPDIVPVDYTCVFFFQNNLSQKKLRNFFLIFVIFCLAFPGLIPSAKKNKREPESETEDIPANITVDPSPKESREISTPKSPGLSPKKEAKNEKRKSDQPINRKKKK